MAAGGKGHARRPSQISEEEENAKWDLIFKKPKLDTLSDENPKEERHGNKQASGEAK
jgi:hypothetical protein